MLWVVRTDPTAIDTCSWRQGGNVLRQTLNWITPEPAATAANPTMAPTSTTTIIRQRFSTYIRATKVRRARLQSASRATTRGGRSGSLSICRVTERSQRSGGASCKSTLHLPLPPKTTNAFPWDSQQRRALSRNKPSHCGMAGFLQTIDGWMESVAGDLGSATGFLAAVMFVTAVPTLWALTLGGKRANYGRYHKESL